LNNPPERHNFWSGSEQFTKVKEVKDEKRFEKMLIFQNVLAWTVLISRNFGVGLAKTENGKYDSRFESLTEKISRRGDKKIRGSTMKELERHTALGEIMLNSDAL